MNKQWEAVRDFHKAFSAPYEERPVLLSRERVVARSEWMREEIDEFDEGETIAEQADAMIDLIYFALGSLVEMGVRPDDLFDIVQTANMSKLWEDGKPHCREDGKVIKPTGWVDPDPLLKRAIERQMMGCG